MRLTDLSPRWIHKDVFIFRCPHCSNVWLSCKRVAMRISEQIDLFEKAMENEADKVVVPSKASVAWKMKGAFEKGNFTVSPSIHAGASGHWHGHIMNGQITNPGNTK